MNAEIAMREKSIMDRIKRVARQESDAMEIDTGVPKVSKTSVSTIDPNTAATPLHGSERMAGSRVDNVCLTSA